MANVTKLTANERVRFGSHLDQVMIERDMIRVKMECAVHPSTVQNYKDQLVSKTRKLQEILDRSRSVATGKVQYL